MATCRCWPLLLLLTTINGQFPDCRTTNGVKFVSQPHNSEVCIGGQARIDCAFIGSSSPPFWRINSTIYTPTQLPPNHMFDGTALVVNHVFLEENGTLYQCFFDLIVNDSLCQLQSTIGKLTVLNSDVCGGHHLGPENITRTEGEANVLIPCTLSGYNTPIWEINGLVYEFFQLPEILTPTYGGIIINLVERSLNGMSFRCYTSTNIGHRVKASSTGYLTVIPKGGPISFNPDSNNLYIDHQNTFFLDQDVTLSWKPVNDSRCNNYEIIFRNKCGHRDSKRITRLETQLLSLNFNLASKNDEDILLKAINGGSNVFVCNVTKATMQIQNDILTTTLHSSFSRTEEFKFSTLLNSTFNLVLPRPGIEEDCLCPIYFYTDNKCNYDLKRCSCLNSTVFSDSITEFCILSDNENISFSIQNLTNQMNGSRLSLFHEFFCEFDYMTPYRIYTHSFEISIVLPEPPVVMVDKGSNEACAYPYNVDGNLPESYIFVLTDITGERFFIHTVLVTNNLTTCILLENETNQSSVCNPTMISVMAVNMFGQMTTTPVPINTENTTGDPCLCINETVNSSVSVYDSNWSFKSSTVTVVISCNQSKYQDLQLEAVISSDVKHNFVCNNTNGKTTFDDIRFSCYETYNVSVYWKSRNELLDVVCLLQQEQFITNCEGFNSLGKIIGISASAIAVLCLLAQIICVVRHRYILRSRSRSLKTRTFPDSQHSLRTAYGSTNSKSLTSNTSSSI